MARIAGGGDDAKRHQRCLWHCPVALHKNYSSFDCQTPCYKQYSLDNILTHSQYSLNNRPRMNIDYWESETQANYSHIHIVIIILIRSIGIMWRSGMEQQHMIYTVTYRLGNVNYCYRPEAPDTRFAATRCQSEMKLEHGLSPVVKVAKCTVASTDRAQLITHINQLI